MMTTAAQAAQAYQKIATLNPPPHKFDKYDMPKEDIKDKNPDFFQEIFRKELAKKLAELN